MTHTTQNEELTEFQKENIKELVKTNEMFEGHRVVVDYAITLAANGDSKLNKLMTDYVQSLY